MQFIAQQLNMVQKKLREIALKYGRDENSVKLLAVSKTRAVEEILQAITGGQLDFGENYQQEAGPKIALLAEHNIRWHFIGSLQANKARSIAEHFAWLHSLDRIKIARRLSSLRPSSLPPLNVCIQLNISAESSKSGTSADEMMALAEIITALPGLRLRGLMAMPAPTNDFDEQRQGFQSLRHYFDQLTAAGHDVDTLSMGTTNDMEAAIAEGATIVRVGTAIFGPRL